MSPRYNAIAGMMEDPLNLACILREIQRRNAAKLAGPLTPKGDHSWVFPTFREILRNGIQKTYSHNSDVDSAAEIFFDGEVWTILIKEIEAGPYDIKARAVEEARSLLKLDGWDLLEKPPWEEEDTIAFPLGK